MRQHAQGRHRQSARTGKARESSVCARQQAAEPMLENLCKRAWLPWGFQIHGCKRGLRVFMILFKYLCKYFIIPPQLLLMSPREILEKAYNAL